jgi:hypothetical protein
MHGVRLIRFSVEQSGTGERKRYSGQNWAHKMEGDDWGDAGKTLVCRQATEPNIGIGIETPVEANS